MKARTEKILKEFFEGNSNLLAIKNNIYRAMEFLLDTVSNDGTIFVCGNGGSAADSQHIAGELLKSFCLKRPITKKFREDLESSLADGKLIADNLQGGIRCIPLDSFVSFQTAFSNDCDGKFSYAQLLQVFAKPKDSLISISTSGNSKNCLYATLVAKILNLHTISLTGSKGGKIKDVADISICSPSDICFNIQEYHIKVYHLLCLVLESETFDI